MTDNIIQQARDALGKWRDEALVNGVDRTDLALIVGTAGNPDLLDALDAMLAVVCPGGRLMSPTWYQHAERIAAAIIAAAERGAAI